VRTSAGGSRCGPVAIATVVLLAFVVAGAALLDLLQISTAAFQLAGGLLLILASIDLIFAHRTGLSSITTDETREATATQDIAVFPLAIPLIAGPGAITAVMLLMQRTSGPAEIGIVVGLLVLVMAATALTLLSRRVLCRSSASPA
jgi:multiple antibiotic resistance protein